MIDHLPFGPMEQHGEEIWPFVAWLQARGPLHHVLEIGVRRGGTAALWHAVSDGTVVGVDWSGCGHGLGNGETRALATAMERALPRYRFVDGNSHQPETRDAVRVALDRQPCDLVFLDGDHSYEGVRADFADYVEFVRPGGVVLFHDIVDSPLIRRAGHGVYRFWRELTGEKHEWCIGGEWGGLGAWVADAK